MTSYIEQPGFISSLNQGMMKIALVGSGGCSSCHKSLCMLRDISQREVEVPCADYTFQVGDEVLVRMKPSAGFTAVAWMYTLPFVLIMASMITALAFHVHEGVAGLVAVLVLVPYYSMLYLIRQRFNQSCKFEVLKR
ncbi:MAG: SoxR reducing system RseC family protein [Cyclobacteriaceae bacterium]|nr:SoxR reducing system RseC family protein [Cyclobacteriaceae bacterium]